MANALVYYDAELIPAVKSFIVQTQNSNTRLTVLPAGAKLEGSAYIECFLLSRKRISFYHTKWCHLALRLFIQTVSKFSKCLCLNFMFVDSIDKLVEINKL